MSKIAAGEQFKGAVMNRVSLIGDALCFLS